MTEILSHGCRQKTGAESVIVKVLLRLNSGKSTEFVCSSIAAQGTWITDNGLLLLNHVFKALSDSSAQITTSRGRCWHHEF